MTERQTLENVAAIKLQQAVTACEAAVDALRDLESHEAYSRASDLWVMRSMLKRWANSLERQHRAKHHAPD